MIFPGKNKKVQEDSRPSRRSITRCCPDAKTGLTGQQVTEREAAGWSNIPVDPPSKSVQEIIRSNIFTYFNLIFTVLAVLLCIAGSFRNLTFLPVVIGNTLIGLIQEIRSKKVLDKLNMLHAPHADVIRDGQIKRVPSEELVLDDVVIFRSGNQICADAVILDGIVQVNEALLTGESDEIVKSHGEALMSGSFVVAGECRARLQAVGEDAYISRLTIEARQISSKEQSEMVRSLNKLVKGVGIILIPMGILLFVISFVYNQEGFQGSITSMVAAVIGMIPEGLYLLTSVALAVSAIRLAGKKVLLHDMKSIETLARVDVLCVDKTGTITENVMRVKKMVSAETGAEPALSEEHTERLLGDFVAAMTNDNATMDALKSFFKNSDGKEAVKVQPFTSSLKYCGVSFPDGTYVLGAPEMVLRGDYYSHQNVIASVSQEDGRALVFGKYEGELNGRPLVGRFSILAYVILSNPIRKEAPETFGYFQEQGVEVKVISGDNPLTVSAIARDAGINNAEHYVDASQLSTDQEIFEAASVYTVFGRVNPEQKRKLVQALKQQGRTVAMTGDGVNDVLALKDADCSIAMASGSDAASQAAQVVLLESDFSCMPSVVLEGRRVVNNIQRSASLFLVKNIFSFLMAIASAVFMITYPLEPSQISLVAMFTIGAPGFFLAFQPNKDRIEGHFLTNVFLKALPGGLTDVLVVGGMVACGISFGFKNESIATAGTILLIVIGFRILLWVCQPFNTFRMVIFLGCIAGVILAGIFVPNLFALTRISWQCILLLVVFALAAEPVIRVLTLATEKLRLFLVRKNTEHMIKKREKLKKKGFRTLRK